MFWPDPAFVVRKSCRCSAFCSPDFAKEGLEQEQRRPSQKKNAKCVQRALRSTAQAPRQARREFSLIRWTGQPTEKRLPRNQFRRRSNLAARTPSGLSPTGFLHCSKKFTRMTFPPTAECRTAEPVFTFCRSRPGKSAHGSVKVRCGATRRAPRRRPLVSRATSVGHRRRLVRRAQIPTRRRVAAHGRNRHGGGPPWHGHRPPAGGGGGPPSPPPHPRAVAPSPPPTLPPPPPPASRRLARRPATRRWRPPRASRWPWRRVEAPRAGRIGGCHA